MGTRAFYFIEIQVRGFPTLRGKAQRGESTCHLHKNKSQNELGHTWKSPKKTPHTNTYRKDTWTHNKGKTHQKGMKTHQEGNAIESDLFSFSLVVLHFGDFSHVKRKNAKRREHMSSAQIDVAKRTWTHMKITEKKTHTNTYRKDTWTHNKGKTHQKGMETHQEGNAIESDLFFIFIGFLTFGDFSHKKRKSAKRREHMSSAQKDVEKRNWAHMKFTEKHYTRTHIEKTHEHTTKGKHIKKAWKHTKRETQLKVICLSFSLVFLHWGFLPR